MKDEKVIGIIYRHNANDYEFMIGNLPDDIEEKISQMIYQYDNGYNLSGYRGDKEMTLADANIDYWESTADTVQMQAKNMQKLVKAFNWRISKALSLSEMPDLNDSEKKSILMDLGACEMLSLMLEKDYNIDDYKKEYEEMSQKIIENIEKGE